MAAEDEIVNRRLSVRQTQRRKLFRSIRKFLRGRYREQGWRVQDIKLQHRLRRSLWPSYSFFPRTFAPSPSRTRRLCDSLPLSIETLNVTQMSAIAAIWNFQAAFVRNKPALVCRGPDISI